MYKKLQSNEKPTKNGKYGKLQQKYHLGMVSNSLQGVGGGGWVIPVILALDSVFVHKHTNLFGTVNG